MWLPDLIYKWKPQLLAVSGLVVIVWLENSIGNFAGLVLMLAGLIVYLMRRKNV